MNITKPKTLIIAVVLLLSYSVSAQKALPIDYFETLNLDYNELQSYMSKFGYNNKSAKKDDYGFDCSWKFKRQAIDSTKTESIYHIYYQKDNTKSISFQTYEREDYLRFKRLMDFKGMKLISKKQYNDFLIEIYANERYESVIHSKPEEYITKYDINLKKLK